MPSFLAQGCLKYQYGGGDRVTLRHTGLKLPVIARNTKLDGQEGARKSRRLAWNGNHGGIRMSLPISQSALLTTAPREVDSKTLPSSVCAACLYR
jgi:hypothetical protein